MRHGRSARSFYEECTKGQITLAEYRQIEELRSVGKGCGFSKPDVVPKRFQIVQCSTANTAVYGEVLNGIGTGTGSGRCRGH